MKQRFKGFDQFQTSARRGTPGTQVCVCKPDLDGEIWVGDDSGEGVYLSPEMFQEIFDRVQLEPVPEPKTPGQVLEAALIAEGFAPLAYQSKDFERVASRLGIKGEG